MSESSQAYDQDAALRTLVSFTVEYADGREEDVPEGGVSFLAGANIQLLTDPDSDEIRMELVTGAGREDPYYRTKYEALEGMVEGANSSGSSGGSGQPAWLFTDLSMWLAKINGVGAEPTTGALFLLGDACHTWGRFEDFSNPGHPSPERVCPVWTQTSSSEMESSDVACCAELELTNICAPCLDCLTYHRIEEYLDRIRTFFDYMFELSDTQSTDKIPPHPDGQTVEIFAGVLPQAMAAFRYWDYLVHKSTVKLSAQSYGQALVLAGYYRNISDRTVGQGSPVGVKLTFLVSFEKVDGGGTVTPWDGIAESVSDIRILDRNSKCSAALGPSGIIFIGSNQIQIETVSGHDLGQGHEIYADVALVLLGTILPSNPAYTYQVQVQMTVSHTHLGPVGSDNPVTESKLVYFRPPDDAEPSA
jgi:hypothetical protein